MSCATSKLAISIGFLTVVENAELGLLGGYLLLNAAARPLEFHCTAPVKPSRTQEILYGPTLRPYLFGEQIGQTLLAKSKLTPVVVCTDSQPVLAARDGTQVPVVLVADGISSELGGGFSLAKNTVMTVPGFENDERAIREAWPPLADHLDLMEPFARIREALEEAQKVTRQAA
jgi:hypothetical protein